MTPTVPPLSTSIRAAAKQLDVTTRQIRRLVQAGRLVSSGKGRVETGSLEKYESTRNKADLFADGQFKGPLDPGYKQIHMKLLRTVPALSLPPAAAKRLGLPQSQLEALINSGAVPTITLGAERFVPGGWLAETLAAAYRPIPMPTSTPKRNK